MLRCLIALVLIPCSVAQASERGAAQAEVDAWLKKKSLRGATIGVHLRDGETGETLAHHGADELLYPASGAKLLTTAAALSVLPSDRRWSTCVEVEERTLHLVGGGALALLEETLDDLADLGAEQAKEGSIERIVVHTGRHDPERLPPAFHMKRTDAGYRPRVGPAGSHYGQVEVTVEPHPEPGRQVRVKTVPSSSAVIVRVDARSVFERAPDTPELSVKASPGGSGRTRIDVRGAMVVDAKPRRHRKAFVDPDATTGYLLRDRLVQRGVKARRASVQVVSSLREVANPEAGCRATLSVAEAVRDINVWSNNFMAEGLLKELSSDLPRQPATWDGGRATAIEALHELGLEPGSFELVNGSGLYMATQVRPSAMTLLLHRMFAHPSLGSIYRDSLGVAGGDGWLKNRLKGKATLGRVRAKTGTLDEVVSLSGVVPRKSGGDLLFSIIINDVSADRTHALRRTIDRLVTRLANL